MITVGLDFGTHQTKVCIEDKDGAVCSYSFMQFSDIKYRLQYTLPSIVGVKRDGLLSYGYLPMGFDGQVIRYFKQAAFYPVKGGMSQEDGIRCAVWYIAYILFDLGHRYSTNYVIQFGVPSDSDPHHLMQAREIATRIVVSAYRLVEDVFQNDKESFLATPIRELERKTEIVAYSDKIKEEYALMVFPEAYACLRPLVSKGKFESGLNLMVDIGGGTTDISLFSVKGNAAQVYDYYSLSKGLNYLTCADKNVDGEAGGKINLERMAMHSEEIDNICHIIKKRLFDEYGKNTEINNIELLKALRNRPIVYCGGGSTIKALRAEHRDFTDVMLVSYDCWDYKSVDDIRDIVERGLCPILSTAYGLAISTVDDKIKMEPFSSIFEFKKAFRKPAHSYCDDLDDYNLYDGAWK